MLGKYVAAAALLEKEYAADIISFAVDVLLLDEHDWLEEGTYPIKKAAGLLLQELEAASDVFEQVY
jgi:hypothetical protein